jgi:hypothetical protein
MSTEIGIALKATDEASSVIADAGRNITQSMQGVEEARRSVAQSQEADASAVDLGTGSATSRGWRHFKTFNDRKRHLKTDTATPTQTESETEPKTQATPEGGGDRLQSNRRY